MRLFSYYISPSKKFGKVRAKSPFEAAKKKLKDRPIFLKGTRYTQPWIYLEAHESTQIKIYEVDEDLGPSQWELEYDKIY